jgi:hypothetical protein
MSRAVQVRALPVGIGPPTSLTDQLRSMPPTSTLACSTRLAPQRLRHRLLHRLLHRKPLKHPLLLPHQRPQRRSRPLHVHHLLRS